jgi:hypothetical protein
MQAQGVKGRQTPTSGHGANGHGTARPGEGDSAGSSRHQRPTALPDFPC